MSPLDTQDWMLTAQIEWKWVGKDQFTTCDYCGGSGEVGGGFKSLDGPEPCPRCFGSGGKMQPRPQHPELPPALVKHMRKAWKDYFDNLKEKK